MKLSSNSVVVTLLVAAIIMAIVPVLDFCPLYSLLPTFIFTSLQMFPPASNVFMDDVAVRELDVKFSDDDWVLVEEKNGIQTFMAPAKIDGLVAFRGVAFIDLHISFAMGPFCDLSMSYKWIDMLKTITAYDADIVDTTHQNGDSRKVDVLSINQKLKSYWKRFANMIVSWNPFSKIVEGNEVKASNNRDNSRQSPFHTKPLSWMRNKSQQTHTDIVHQVLSLPWPIANRDILLLRKWNFSRSTRSVTLNYKSIESDIIPPADGVIRAVSPHTLWRFTAISSDGSMEGRNRNSRTKVEIECLVDSKGRIPKWFINFMQRSWPSKALKQYRLLAEGEDLLLERVVDW